jgi:hypothetical protein
VFSGTACRADFHFGATPGIQHTVANDRMKSGRQATHQNTDLGFRWVYNPRHEKISSIIFVMVNHCRSPASEHRGSHYAAL